MDNPDAASESLNFDRAEFDSNPGNVCAQCSTPITDTYFTVGTSMFCDRCHATLRAATAPGIGLTRFGGASALGGLAGVLGGGLWLLVTELTGYEIGLIAIAVGFLVGTGVRLGSRGIGGVVYQLLAVALTYSAIVMTYVPAIANEMIQSEEFQSEFQAGVEEGTGGEADAISIKTGAWIVAIPFAFAVPFLLGFENIIGLLIIGFALWQAWKMNARESIDWKGPFRLGAGDTPA